MKKVLLIVVIVAAVVLGGIFLLQKGNKDTNNSNTNNTQQKNEEKTPSKSKTLTIEEFKTALSNAGYTITNESIKSAELIGGREGYSLQINSDVIEIYEFDLNSSSELTKSNIKSAKNNGKITMPAFGDYELDAKINKNLILLSYDNHPDKDGIIEVFNNL